MFSQNGEDGVIQELLRRLGARSRYFVEFGASRGEQANCVLLARHYGWRGLFIEPHSSDYTALESNYRSNPRIATRRALVTAANIEGLLREAGVPPAFDVLSVDIDGNDYWVWQAIESFTPRMVVVEYNGNLGLDQQVVMPRNDEHEWDGTDYVGASLGAYRVLAAEKGYELAHTDRTGVNAFFVRLEEVAALSGLDPAPAHPANYYAQGMRLPKDPLGRPFEEVATGELIEAARNPGT